MVAATTASRLTQLLPDLAHAAVDVLACDASTEIYERGETVLGRGERDRLGVVAGGLIDAKLHSSDGRSATLSYLRRGELLGVVSIFRPMPVELSAVDRSAVIWLDAGTVTKLAQQHASVVWQLARAASDWSLAMEAAAHAFAFDSVGKRLAAHLLALAPPRGEVRMTQQGLADAIGSVREVVAREVANFRRRGMIEVSRGTIRVVDEVALRRHCAWARHPTEARTVPSSLAAP
jgi:CRP/FNR family transcriptional regulator